MKLKFDVTNRWVTPAKAGISGFAIAIMFAACTIYDNYDIDLMQDASATVDGSSASGKPGSSGDATSSSSKKPEPPAFSSKNLSFSVDENAAVGTTIGTVKVSNAVGSEKYSIVDEGSLFGIDEKTGAISVKKAEIDYEKKSEYSVKVAVSNSEGRDTATVSISVTDVNEKPSVTAAAFTVAENSASGTLVGTVVADDPDTKNLAFGKITYSLVDSTSGASSLFKIDDSGRITVAQGADLDFEKKSLYYVKVIVTDKTNSDTAVVSIQLTDVEEIPPSSSSQEQVPSSSSFECDGLTDSRDSVTYKTFAVQLTGGVKKCFMAENLRYVALVGKSICYSDEEHSDTTANCAKYGRLYNYIAASSSCPRGWHLPSPEEFKELTKKYRDDDDSSVGRHFKATEGWDQGGNGDNAVGFTALPGGFCDYDKICEYMGKNGFWWTTESPWDDDIDVHTTLFFTCSNDVYNTQGSEDETYVSVRCVKD